MKASVHPIVENRDLIIRIILRYLCNVIAKLKFLGECSAYCIDIFTLADGNLLQ